MHKIKKGNFMRNYIQTASQIFGLTLLVLGAFFFDSIKNTKTSFIEISKVIKLSCSTLKSESHKKRCFFDEISNTSLVVGKGLCAKLKNKIPIKRCERIHFYEMALSKNDSNLCNELPRFKDTCLERLAKQRIKYDQDPKHCDLIINKQSKQYCITKTVFKNIRYAKKLDFSLCQKLENPNLVQQCRFDSLYFHFLNNGKKEDCRPLKKKKEKEACYNFSKLQLAIRSNSLSSCKELPVDTLKNECSRIIISNNIFSGKWKIDYCQKLKNKRQQNLCRNEAAHFYALKSKRPEICDKSTHPELVFKCKQQVVGDLLMAGGDSSLCDNFKDYKKRSQCLGHYKQLQLQKDISTKLSGL